MLFNSLATGLFLTAAAGELIFPDVFAGMARVAYPLALVCLSADLLCLVLDLGDSLRFHHMLRVFKPTSPMSLGTWCLTIYSFPLTVVAALSLSPLEGSVWDGIRKTAVILALLPALGSAVYKGVLLSTTVQPGWRDARWLGGYLTSSSLLLGCALMLALAIFLKQDRAIPLLHPALVILILLNAIPLWLLIVNLWPTLSRTYQRGKLIRMALLCIGSGPVVPLGLLLVTSNALAMLTAAFLLLAGSLNIRYVIVRLPHDATQRT
jgi:Ni/Fe-hydrogenase subunit HybB-like protein